MTVAERSGLSLPLGLTFGRLLPLLLIAAGCIGSDSVSSLPESKVVTSSTQSDSGTIPDESPVQVTYDAELLEGESDTSFSFEAPDPATHVFDVMVSMPVDARLEIRFLTVGGGTLLILDDERMAESCMIISDKRECLVHFPSLGAWREGTWTAEVRKLSTPPAQIAISIQWIPLG